MDISEDKWLVLLNPNAGGGQAETDWWRISLELKEQGFNFDLVRTRYRMDAVQLIIEKIGEGYRKIIAIGGDGTLHEVVNGVMIQQFVPSTEILLGIIAVGTGNDWIKTHNISLDYKKAIGQIKQGQTIIQDVGELTYLNGNPTPQKRYFINSVGIGFDARVVQYIQPHKERGKHGKSVYFNGLISSLFAHKNIDALIHIDEKKLDTSLFNLTVGLCRYKGGGFKLLPNAIPDDGILDVTLASKISKMKLLRCLPKIFGGKVDQIKYFDFYQAFELNLYTNSPVCVEADGEFLGLKPLRVSVIPNQLRLISNYYKFEG